MHSFIQRSSSIRSFVGTLAISLLTSMLLFVVLPLSALAANGTVIVDSINGQPPTGHCIAGPLVIVVHGFNGSDGGPYFVVAGNGFSTSSPVSTGNGGHTPVSFSNITINYTPSGAGSNLYINLYHGESSGNDSHVTIVNQCIAPPTKGVLTVSKVVDNTGGGSATASSFTLHVKNATSSAEVSGSPFHDSGAGTDFQLLPNTYVVSEDSAANYTGVISCTNVTDNTPIAGSSVILVAGKNYSCTVTNTFVPPTTITLVKTVSNTHGGTATTASFQGKIDGGNVPWSAAQNVSAGVHTASETGLAGYTAGVWGGACAANGSITVVAGHQYTCTITNSDQAGTLTVIKHVSNTHGGTKVAGNFTMNVTGTNVSPSASFAGAESPGITVTLNAGSYSVDEGVVAGYTKSLGANCSGTILNGETKTCTITNSDQQGTLTVVKHVVNDNGGTLLASAFTLHVTATNPSSASFVGDENGTPVTVDAGSYSVSEDAVTGYAMAGNTCSGVIAIGEHKTCTITNDDEQATLTVTKVVNNIRFTYSVSNFNLFAGLTQVVSGVSHLFNAGSYAVTETGPTSNYNAVFSGDCNGSGNITLRLGETKTCTITNTEKTPGTLHVIKHVVNDNPEGFKGTASAPDFTLTVTGGHPNPPSVTGNESGSPVTIDAGAEYSVAETGGPTGSYGVSYSAGCVGTMPESGDVICTVTNNDNPPTTGGLTVIKIVTNDNGGTAQVSSFPLHVTDDSQHATSVTSGVNNQFAGGSYTVSETGDPTHYQESFSGDCNADGAVTVVNGQSKTCTITNNDIAPSLTLIKHVSNTHGGTAVTGNWTLSATGPTTISGAGGVESNGTFSAGTYTLSEGNGPAGYSAGNWSCTGVENNGTTIALGLGQSATCEITNSDTPGTLHIVKHVVNDNGGTKVAGNFTLHTGGSNPSLASFPGSENGTDITVDAGQYSVSEDAVEGYAATLSKGCSGTIGNGETKFCTVTNDDGKATLTIVKHTLGADGTFAFSVTSGDFSDPQSITTENNAATTTVPLDAGSYNVVETVPTGWTLNGVECVYDNDSIESSIPNGEVVTLGSGDEVTCTFTNTRQTGSLKVIKVVSGGTATSSDFMIHVKSGESDVLGSPQPGNLLGTLYSGLGTGAYSVSETGGPANYQVSFSGDCNAEGQVAVTNGEGSAMCTVTNTRVNLPACSDGIDNDHDGKTDSADPACHNDNNPDNPASYTPNVTTEDDAADHPSGGGGVGAGPIGGGGGGGGLILGASTSTGQVLGASCGVYMDKYVRLGKKNNADQVKKLQTFLNKWQNSGLPITGIYGPLTFGAIQAFQGKHADSILKPWGIASPTGIVYKTTLRQVNFLECPELTLALPELIEWSKNVSDPNIPQ